jgi:hypothetical protein
MKKLVIFLGIWCTIWLDINAQINKTWIPSNAPYQIGGWGMGLLAVDTNLLISGTGIYGANASKVQYRKIIGNLSYYLDTINISKIEIDSVDLLTLQGSILKISDSIYSICETNLRTFDTLGLGNAKFNYHIRLRFVDRNLIEVNKKEFYGLGKSYGYCNSFINNKIIITGYSSITDLTKARQAYILCLNDTGAILWQTYLGENNKEDIAFSSAPAADGGYLISARTDLTRYPIIGNDDSIDANNSIYKLDSNGTLQWKKVLWRSSHGVIARIQPEGLGNYYIGNAQDTTWEADDKKGYTATIAKIDELGNIIWQKYFNDEPFAYKGIWDFKTLANGDVLLIGGVFGGGNYPGERTGWLCRMAPNGYVVWQHYYKSYAATNFGVLCDAVELSNGDLVITGSASDSVSGGKQAIWLLRTDAQGCLLQGCNPLGTVQLEPIQAMQLVAYPNPTNSNIILQSNNGSLLQGVVQVLNAQGQMVYSVLQKTAIAKINIPLAKQASGVYFVRYVSAINNAVSTLQVVKE